MRTRFVAFSGAAAVAAPLKADLRLGIEDRAAKPRTDFAQPQPFDRHSPATIPTVKTAQSRVGIVLQAGQKKAAVPVMAANSA